MNRQNPLNNLATLLVSVPLAHPQFTAHQQGGNLVITQRFTNVVGYYAPPTDPDPLSLTATLAHHVLSDDELRQLLRTYNKAFEALHPQLQQHISTLNFDKSFLDVAKQVHNLQEKTRAIMAILLTSSGAMGKSVKTSK